MRRMLVGLAVVSVVLGACGDERVGGELVYLDTGSGFAAVELAQHRVAFEAVDGVSAPDWSAYFRAGDGPNGRQVSAADPATGRTLWSAPIGDAALVPRVSARGGEAVVLAAPPAPPGAYPTGREMTSLIVARRAGAMQSLSLRGNYDPEAFSTDGRTLFLVEYSPPLAPDHYRVRQLDLRTGAMSGVSSPDKHVQENMRGTARTQAMAPDGSRLYTLYTLEVRQPDGSTDRLAFVHVLDLAEKWAHCVDLPPSFASGDSEASTALAVSPDGRHLFAASSQTGDVADVDTRALRVTRSARAPVARGEQLNVAAVRDGGLVIGNGERVVALDAGLSPAQTWRFDSPVTGVRLAGSSVYVSLKDSMAVLRPGQSAVRLVALPTKGAVVGQLVR